MVDMAVTHWHVITSRYLSLHMLFQLICPVNKPSTVTLEIPLPIIEKEKNASTIHIEKRLKFRFSGQNFNYSLFVTY